MTNNQTQPTMNIADAIALVRSFAVQIGMPSTSVVQCAYNIEYYVKTIRQERIADERLDCYIEAAKVVSDAFDQFMAKRCS